MDGPVTRPYPALAGRPAAAQRVRVDAAALDQVRVLEDAYYGTATAWDDDGNATARARDGWRHGNAERSVTIGGRAYGYPGSLPAAKALLDRLHGLIWCAHAASLTLQKKADGVPLVEDEDLRLAVDKQAVKAAAREGDDVRGIIPAHLRAAFDAQV